MKILLVVLLSFISTAWAYELTSEDLSIIEKSKNILESGDMKSDDYFQNTIKSTGTKYLVFLSLSLSDDEMVEILNNADPETDFYLRGVLNPNDLMNSIIRIKKLTLDIKPEPNLLIHPKLFKEYSINKVPTVIATQDGELVGRVAGITSLRYLKEKINAGLSGDFGQKGVVENIIEVDLMEEMQKRMASIDWNSKKEDAKSRWWSKQQFIYLPDVIESKIKYINPTVVSNKPIYDEKGNVIVKKGSIVNPLESIDYHKKIYVFDPQDKKQFSFVKDQTSGVHAGMVVLIGTNLGESLESYHQSVANIGHHIFRLNPPLAQALQLEAIPSVISVDKHLLKVEQVNVNEI